MHKLYVWLSFSILLLSLYVVAQASFSVTASYETDGRTVSVQSRYVNEKHTLYLPGNWDISKVYITFSGQDVIRIGDTYIRSGEVNDLSSCLGKKQKFYNAKGRQMAGTLSILQGSPLPSVHLTVRKRYLNEVNKSKDSEITDGEVLYVESDGRVSYDGRLTSFKGRGNSTFAYSKKPYQLKLEEKANLSGMGKAKTWILLANWLDLSQMRNQMMLKLAKAVGIPYALDCQMADVYINGNYNGLYLITEKIQIGKQRVAIANLEETTEAVNEKDVSAFRKIKETDTEGLQMLRGYAIPRDPEDITGGYILEIEKTYRFTDHVFNGFRTSNGLSVTIKEPTYSTRAQVAYIGKRFSDFHKAVLSEDGKSPDTGMYYSDYIDLPSFALKWWMEEISKNYDAFASSQFYFKDSDLVDGKIYAGPIWDYDLSFGNITAENFRLGRLPERDYVVTYTTKKTNLYRALYAHEEFKELLRATYLQTVRPALAVLLGEKEGTGDFSSLQNELAKIEDSCEMNFTRWPESIVSGYDRESGTTHAQSVDFLMRFLRRRVDYLDSVWLEHIVEEP